jgi:hypothetical protein
MKIPSFDFACKKLKYNPKTVLSDVSKKPKHLQKHTIAREKLEIIHEASWDGVEIDYDNPEQKKWGFWVWMNKPGFRLDGVGYDFASSFTCGGPRLCCLSEEDMRYHFEKHFTLYKDAIVIPKRVSQKKKK